MVDDKSLKKQRSSLGIKIECMTRDELGQHLEEDTKRKSLHNTTCDVGKIEREEETMYLMKAKTGCCWPVRNKTIRGNVDHI